MEKSPKLKGILLTAIGLFAIGAGIYLFNQKLDFIAGSIETGGVVVKIESSQTRQTTYYYPVVSYTDSQGQSFTFTSSIGSSAAFDYMEGEPVTLRYIQGDPESATIVSFWEMWGIISVVNGMGVIFSLIGASILYQSFSGQSGTKQQ